ncbi:MAG: hypothetical protein ACREQH_15845 [Candidatus Binatus sp.]
MNTYWFCGFVLVSDTPIPELNEACSGAADGDRVITVHLGEVSPDFVSPSEWFMRQSLPDGAPWSARARTRDGYFLGDGYFLRFHELADFLVDHGGQHIRCVARHPTVSDLTIRALLLDQVMPPVIALHGRYVLHAAAIRTDAGVCVFAGDSGAGKSTIAAQLAAVGGDFLTDDCLVIDEQEGVVVAWASHPSIKLRDDAIQFLKPGGQSEPVAEYTTKRRVSAPSLGAAFPREPLPVARIYFLTRGDDDAAATSEPLIERLPPRAAFMKLVKHSIRLDSVDRAMLEREFQFTRRIVDTVPAALLSLPNDLSKLRLAHDAIVADLASN